MFTKYQKQMYQTIMSYLLFTISFWPCACKSRKKQKITRNNWLAIFSSVPNKIKASISRKQRGCTCTLAQCHHFSLIHSQMYISKIKRGKICSQNRAHDPALSDDTQLNLREKTTNCTQYYENQNEEYIRQHIRLIVTIYDENVSPREVDWSVVKVSNIASFTSAHNKF